MLTANNKISSRKSGTTRPFGSQKAATYGSKVAELRGINRPFTV